MTEPAARSMEQYLDSLGGSVYRYGNASHAFKDILLALNAALRRDRPNVVMPSFIPAKLYRTVVAAGYEPRFYDITEDGCGFDPQEVADLVDDQTTSVFAIHYFGFPADVMTLKEIASLNGIALIEDCAHVLVGSLRGKALGTIGDFSIFSTRKMLQLPDGGLLLVNKDECGFEPTYESRVRSMYSSWMLMRSRAKRLMLMITGGNDLFRLTRPSRVGMIDPKRKPELRVRRMSLATEAYGRLADIDKNSRIRRENYTRLAEALREFGFLRPIYEQLPENWTPYSLPMMVEQDGRTILQAELLKHGISCGLGWPESPFGCRHPSADGLSRGLIEFPIHPLVLENQFDRMLDACKAYERKYVGD